MEQFSEDRKLPQKAYDALKALKAQAAAATCLLSDSIDRSILRDAQRLMKQNEPWTGMVFSALLRNREGITIDSASEEWLEMTFTEGK